MYYLKACLQTFDGGDLNTIEACVSNHESLLEAQQQKDVEELCWSDEGVSYYIQEGEYPYWEIDNVNYDYILNRVQK